MQGGELLSFSSPSSSSSSSSTATSTMNYHEDSGANMNSSEAEQMERDLESLALDDKLVQLELKGREDEDEDEDEDEEFSFVCANPDGSPISADDAFQNGQIRPMYPLFNRGLLFVEEDDSSETPLRKVFVEKRAPNSESELEEGSYCEWSPSTAELGKKSNSTGFSKLWRLRDFMSMHRSSSDGKDAFVFLTSPNNSTKNKQPADPARTSAPKLNRLMKPQTQTVASASASAHETHYVRSRAQKQVDKRRSYLPYRQDLVGFFTNVNGFSKNVHPF